MSKVIVSRDWIKTYVETQPRAKVEAMVGRALVALLKRQTSAEQHSNVTNEENGIGFSGADARSGSLSAKSFIKNKGKLLDWQLGKWTKPARNGYPRIAKYHRQLNEIARAKRPAQQELMGCSRAQYVAAKGGF
ncbi:MAG: hypothetical protein DRJ15_13170 [Bacteroidetes bacterium]|nr:MAG: hypothetical protein DRJ15_13170 [Bacteroidota bacterium]